MPSEPLKNGFSGAIHQYPWKSFGKYLINTLIAAIMVFAMRDFISNILSLFIVLMIGGLVYLIASYVNKGFDDADRKILNEAIGKKIWMF
jgi:hypothetical protein